MGPRAPGGGGAANASAPLRIAQRYNRPLNKAYSARKLVALDGIRGLAIFAVFLNHGGYRVSREGTIHEYIAQICMQGWVGVDLFFVLSGFLITGILLDSRGAENYFRSFYARRALRIFPLYYAFLALAFTVFPWTVTADWQPDSGDRWLYFCYLTNWLGLWKGSWHANIIGHLWSLAVEEQFYFCWPLLVFVWRPRTLLKVLVGLEAAAIGGRAVWVAGLGHQGTTEQLATITRMDGLLFGAVVAILVREYRIPEAVLRALPWISAAGLAAFSACMFLVDDEDRFTLLYAYPWLAMSFAMLVLYAVVREDSRAWLIRCLKWRRLTQAGKYAYGIYIFHVPLLYFGNRLLLEYDPRMDERPVWIAYLTVAVLWTICYYTAWLSYRYFESYFLGFKDRFTVRPQRALQRGYSGSVKR